MFNLFKLLATILLIGSSLTSFGQVNSHRSGPVKIAIIGGGVTGTKLASLLQEEFQNSEVETHIFEAMPAVGGRTHSRKVTLSNGRKVIINTGTQMNFEAFIRKVSPELGEIKNLFYKPNQAILLGAAGKLNYVPRANPLDPEESTQIGQELVKGGLLTDQDVAFSALASNKLDRKFLRELPFDDLIKILEKNSSWDSMSAHEFLYNHWRPKLVDHTGWGNWFGARRMMSDYRRLPQGLAKADKGADILENAMYWGVFDSENIYGFSLPYPLRRVSNVYFTKNYIRRMIESMESLVEFTDLHSMSALNFLWQLKWTIHGGDMIVARDWNAVPKFFLAKATKAFVHPNHWISKIKKAKRKFQITAKVQSISRPGEINEMVYKDFDIVINTVDSDTALTILDEELIEPELRSFLEKNTYTSTVAIHVEVEASLLRSLLSPPAPALVAGPGYLKHLGGTTFLSHMSGQDLGDREVVGLFAQSDSARELMAKASLNNWSQVKLGEEAFKLLVSDLSQMSSRIGSRPLNKLVGALESAGTRKIVSSKGWKKALPHFGVGHMNRVSKYHEVMGTNKHFYLGQVLYGRSVAMVLPGIERDFSKIVDAVESLRQ